MPPVKPPRELPAYLIEPHWYVLWAPMGFGGTTERVFEIEKIVKQIDPNGGVWYPLYPEMVDGKTVMRAVYPGYMFIRCMWNEAVENVIQERLPVVTVFLKDEDRIPFCVTDEVMRDVEDAVSGFLVDPDTDLHGLKVGDMVKIVRKVFAGQVGKIVKFDAKGRVILEMSMFGGREVEASFEPRDLQRI